MDLKEMLELHERLCNAARAEVRDSSPDFAREDDPFENFRTFGGLGILVRISDKLARLRRFEENGAFAAKNESLEDTVLKLINYSIAYLGFKQDEKERAEEVLPEPVSISK